SRGANMAAQTNKLIGRPDKAIAWAMLAQRNEPHPAENEASVGDCWSQLGDDDRAEVCYKHFSELHPEQPDGWLGMCELRLRQGKIEESRQLYKENVSDHSEFAYSKQMAAKVEFWGRNFPEAARLYGELFAREAGGGGCFYGCVSYRSALGRIRMEENPLEGRRILEEASQIEQDLLQKAPESADVLYRLAAIEASLGKTDSAIDHLKSAFRSGWIYYRSARSDPRFDSLQTNPDFSELVEAMATQVASLRMAAIRMVKETTK